MKYRLIVPVCTLVFVLITGALQMAECQSSFTNKCEEIIDNKDDTTDDIRLIKYFETVWDYQMAEFPEWATYNGYPGHDHRWSDRSLKAIERRKQDRVLQAKVLASIDRSKLSSDNQLNYDLFQHKLNDDIDADRFPDELMPINQMGGVQQNIAGLLKVMPATKLSELKNIIARLKAIPEVIEQTLLLLEHGSKAGVTPPRVTLRDVPQQVKNQIVSDPAKAPMLIAFADRPPSIAKGDWQQMQQEAFAVYRQEIVPALERLHNYLTQTYIPACRESIGCADLPQGKEWYAHLVKHYTTTDLSPEQIFQIGLSEVERIKMEMKSIIDSLNFDGDFADFCEFLRSDPQFFFNDTESLLSAYRDIAKRIDPELIRLFGHLPRLPYGVIAIPSYAEKSQTTAYYQSGSFEAGRAGYFYANTYDLKSRPKWEMEALTLHEAVPGHHFQISLAQELEELPEFRKHGWVTAYGEGWALYAESLGETIGLYENPYSKFGQLTYEMWRAIRLVVDVGIHAKGWSRRQAIEFFTEHSCKVLHDVEVEVDRYIVWPGQALAYKIGELKIKELRAYAKKQLGENFNLREFHDQVLGSGSLPLSVLENKIHRWVESTK